ncbi:ubiquinol-cytochrome C chaperone family protein [Thermaurantiacus sp.]
MSLLSRLLTPREPPMAALWRRITALARTPELYARHGVPDTVDGRFDMVALVASLVMLKFEAAGAKREGVLLTERFVDDMDASVRELGIGDLVVGKHVGNMIGALGGRLGAYRAALASPQPRQALAQALARNLFRGSGAGDPDAVACWAIDLYERLKSAPVAELVEGRGL